MFLGSRKEPVKWLVFLCVGRAELERSLRLRAAAKAKLQVMLQAAVLCFLKPSPGLGWLWRMLGRGALVSGSG